MILAIWGLESILGSPISGNCQEHDRYVANSRSSVYEHSCFSASARVGFDKPQCMYSLVVKGFHAVFFLRLCSHPEPYSKTFILPSYRMAQDWALRCPPSPSSSPVGPESRESNIGVLGSLTYCKSYHNNIFT